MVMSVRPGLRPSVRPSVRPSQFSALFSYMLWHIDLKFCISLYFYARKIKFESHPFPSLFAGVMLLWKLQTLTNMQFSALFSYMLWHIEFKFCIWLCFNVPQSKFECRHFASIFDGVMPLCELRILEIHSFPHFSLTCFDILSWSFAYDFVLLYYRSSSSVVNLRQFLWELCPFWNLEYLKYTVFRTFLLHPLTYWAESLHITLIFLYYRSSLGVVHLRLFWIYASFRTYNTLNTVFCTFLLHALTYWAEILHMTLFYCTTGQLQVSSMGINFCRSNVPFGT